MRKFRKRVVVYLNTGGLIKLGLSGFLLVLALYLLTYELPSTRTWTYWTTPLSGKVIALDAGHGGPDGGAVSESGVIEKDINLAISLYLRDYLQQAGAIVLMTRESDQDLADADTKGYSKRKTEDLLRRVDFIRKNKADLLVSVHLNSIPSNKWSGAQTFYSPQNTEGKVLSTLIQEELKASLGNTERLARPENTVYLLKATELPASLIEVGFLSNPGEASLLATEKYQKKLAEAIYRGILRYCSGEKVNGVS
ncbi:N-acetylmuramoyl-L-alanine amidase CwlD [Paenibacillus sp. y28]|uniref:N-acetylmuramoyl-L-alanine amidase CwlD n=1 Tax=Paenibacillus sp. y28 TaxID=3129110 RepID=UPI0030199440